MLTHDIIVIIYKQGFSMTADEVIQKIYEIMVRDRLSQRKISKYLSLTPSSLSLLLSKKRQMSGNRIRFLQIALEMYEKVRPEKSSYPE